MAEALPPGYEPLGRRGLYGRAVEVYGITRVARSSAIAFGWCTCCSVEPGPVGEGAVAGPAEAGGYPSGRRPCLDPASASKCKTRSGIPRGFGRLSNDHGRRWRRARTGPPPGLTRPAP